MFLISIALLAILLMSNVSGEFELFAAFSDGDEVPLKHTCNGMNESPVLFWEGVPEETDSFAVVMIDSDSGMIHWLMWDIPGSKSSLEQGERIGKIGTTSFQNTGGYRGPCLDTGAKHKFSITLYALSQAAKLDELTPMSQLDEFARVITDAVLGTAKLSFVSTGHTFGSEDAHEAIRNEARQLAEGAAAAENPVKKSLTKGNPKLKTTLSKDLLCYGCIEMMKRGFDLGKVLAKGRKGKLKQVEVAEAMEALCEENDLTVYAFPPMDMARSCRFLLATFDEEFEQGLLSSEAVPDVVDQVCRETTAVCDGYTEDDITRITLKGPGESYDSMGRKWARKETTKSEL